ncbi:hypothetical protein SAMN06298216_1283 [Spirosomataceae bacterium TFI 002]|nr:hypothetical protein SAMN06298216_1283 [Spirosomataceae bacterium TFI 002]
MLFFRNKEQGTRRKEKGTPFDKAQGKRRKEAFGRELEEVSLRIGIK